MPSLKVRRLEAYFDLSILIPCGSCTNTMQMPYKYHAKAVLIPCECYVQVRRLEAYFDLPIFGDFLSGHFEDVPGLRVYLMTGLLCGQIAYFYHASTILVLDKSLLHDMSIVWSDIILPQC